MVDTGALISPISAGLVASAGLLEAEGATLSAPRFKVRPFTGVAVEMPLLTVRIWLGR